MTRRSTLDALRAIRQINRLITRERDRDSLLSKAAQALVDEREDVACTIVLLEGERVERTFEAGDLAYLSPGTAADEHASLTVAIASEGRRYGVLTAIVPRDAATNLDEVELLGEIAADLGFALRSMELAAESEANARHSQENEFRYQLLADNLSDVIWVLDLETQHFSYVSPSVQRLRGYTVEEVMAEGAGQSMTPSSAAHIQRVLPGRLERFLSGLDEVYADIIEQPTRDGRVARTETTTRFGRDPVNGHLVVFGVSRDISQRERADALQAQLSHVAQSVPGVMHSFVAHPEGGGCMPFTTAAAEDVFGVSQAELARDMTAWAKNVHPSDAARVAGNGDAAVRAGQPWHDVYRYNHPVKGLRWIEGWSTPVRGGDGTWVWHGFAMDVTERQCAFERVERLSRLYRALSDTNEAIARFVDEETLFRQVCDIVMELGAIEGVAIGELESGHVLCWRAQGGPAAERLRGRPPRVLDASVPTGTSLVSAALRTGETQIANDRPWAAVAAGIALPLRCGAEVTGVLSIGASERDYFDAEVVHLLESMARNLSFGLEHATRERALAESEARFRTIFELAPVGVAWIDSKTSRFKRANRRYCEILGYTSDELLSMSWQDVTHPDDVARNIQSHATLLAGEVATYQTEKRYIRKDGQLVWVELGVKRAWSESEAPGFHVTVALDITARKRAEHALRTSEERYRMLVDNIADLVFTTDMEGRYTFLSRAIERYGWAPSELLGKTLANLVHPEDLPEVVRYRSQLVAEHSAGQIEYRLTDAHGKTRFVRSTVQPILEGGQLVGLSGVLVDLTQQRETEEQLRFAQKMEAVGRLAGGIAHDFNNLLSVIECYAELAIDAVRPGDPLRDDLLEIRAAGKRAEGLTRQLLAFSRKQLLKPELLDLNALVERVDRMLRRVLGEDVELHLVRDEAIAPIKADPGQLEQILMNLAINARDAMPDGGSLTIATQSLNPASVRLTVTDTGHGMDEATCAKAFEPFFTTKPSGKGTGLGLSMVYGIVQQSGGTIATHSEVGRGTTIEIVLPAVAGVVVGLDVAVARGDQSRGAETLLVVEDEPAVRNLAKRILSSAGYNVMTAANGGEALLTCEQHADRIHLMLSDIIMPGMNGPELARRVARLRPDMKVLFMSGYADDAFGGRFVLDAGVQVVDKPFTSEALTQRVRAVLDGR